jgi:cytoskeletal protein RodZ
MSGEESTSRTAGEMLRAARQVRGISLAEVAAITRVSEAQLAALENDDYDKLSGALYARSFLRSYALAVGAPVDEVLDHYDRQTGAAPRADTSAATWQEEVQIRRVGRSGAVLWLRAIGLIILALLAALILARVLVPSGNATGAVPVVEAIEAAVPAAVSSFTTPDSARSP